MTDGVCPYSERPCAVVGEAGGRRKKPPGTLRGAPETWKSWPASHSFHCLVRTGCHPGAFLDRVSLPHPDNHHYTRLPRRFETFFDCVGLWLLSRTTGRSALDFKRYLPELPRLGLPHTVPPVRPVAGSHVIRRGQCLACWLLASVCLRFSLSPGRFSAAQDSTTARLPPTQFITTDLADPMVRYTHHTPKASSRDAVSA